MSCPEAQAEAAAHELLALADAASQVKARKAAGKAAKPAVVQGVEGASDSDQLPALASDSGSDSESRGRPGLGAAEVDHHVEDGHAPAQALKPGPATGQAEASQPPSQPAQVRST